MGPALRLLLFALLAVLLWLQYRLWVAEDGLRQVWHLERAVEEQQQENAGLEHRNRELEAEVVDLKQGLSAVEERARSELGMIRGGETFHQVVELPEGDLHGPPNGKSPAQHAPPAAAPQR